MNFLYYNCKIANQILAPPRFLMMGEVYSEKAPE